MPPVTCHLNHVHNVIKRRMAQDKDNEFNSLFDMPLYILNDYDYNYDTTRARPKQQPLIKD